MWNVKDIENERGDVQQARFNRYIVECKGTDLFRSLKLNSDLIDTLWNVKGFCRQDSGVSILDLIDTLWNVKASPIILSVTLFEI